LDVCKERDYVFENYNQLDYVSILVLLDVCKELHISGTQAANETDVSILVLLDVCKEPGASTLADSFPVKFQSLFYWMYVKNSN